MLGPSTATRVRLQRRPDFSSPIMYQTWRDQLFLHWEVRPEYIQNTLPAGMYVDTYEGHAYVSVVLLALSEIHPRGLPRVPGIANHLELILRTYVFNQEGLPGIWFYSLDADNWLSVKLARSIFSLPYFKATIDYGKSSSGEYLFESSRKGSKKEDKTKLKFSVGNFLTLPSSDTLEFFLLERYVFFGYSKRKQELIKGRIHHKPHAIRNVILAQCQLGLLEANFEMQMQPPCDLIHFSGGVDVEVFGLTHGETASEETAGSIGFTGYPETAFSGEPPIIRTKEALFEKI